MLGTLIGPYRVTKKIGQGGMGAVFEAVHETIERRVAIKVLKPELASQPTVAVRFINEARAVNLVNHPGIVQISDYGQTPDGHSYIVMELLEGETLSRRMARQGGRLQVAEVLRLIRQITSALAAAHQKNIIHRDLKPDNVMLVLENDGDSGERERVKILDFGIAKVTSAPLGANKEHTMADTVLGSPEYMSPEQCKGNTTDITAKADMYSLGVIMYRMLCGRLPHVAANGSALLAMHIYETPAPLRSLAPNVPEPLAELVHRMLGKTAEERPSALQVFGATEQLAAIIGTAISSMSLNALRSDQVAALQSGAHRNVSTIGTATGQTGEETARKWPWIFGLLAISALSLIFGTLLLRGPHRGMNRHAAATQPMEKLLADPAPILGAAAHDNAENKLRPMWTVESSPPGAQVVRVSDGVVLGVTPWQSVQPPGVESTPVRLRLAGYSERTLTLQPGADVIYSPTLLAKGRHGKGHGSLKDQPDSKNAGGNDPPKQDVKHVQPEIAD